MRDIFIQSKVIDIFTKLRWRPPPSSIFSLCDFAHFGVLAVWYLCYEPNLVHIICLVTEIDTHTCFTRSFDDVTRINFWFRLSVMSSSPGRRDASSHIIWCEISLSSPKLLTFFRNSRWRPPPSWIFSLCEFGHSGVLAAWYLCSVPNLAQITRSHGSVTSVVRATRQVNSRRQTYAYHHTHSP